MSGDVKAVGTGILEMRIDYGPGYRVYFVRRGTLNRRRKLRPSLTETTTMIANDTIRRPTEYLNTPETTSRLHNGSVRGRQSRNSWRDAIGVVARARGNRKKIAKESRSQTEESLYKALGETGNPEFSTVFCASLQALGLTLSAHPARHRNECRAKRRAA